MHPIIIPDMILIKLSLIFLLAFLSKIDNKSFLLKLAFFNFLSINKTKLPILSIYSNG